MNWPISSRNFARAGGGFYLTVLNGGRLATTWGSATRSGVIIFRFQRELTPRGSSIAVRIVVKSFRESAACTAQSPVLPAAGNTIAVSSMRVFGFNV